MKRTLCAAAFFAIALAGALPSAPARADHDTVVIQAQGNLNLVDFFALSGTRAHLRVSVARKGLDAAFSDWLRQERPRVYQKYVK
jgi:hypothetical protein